MTKDSAPTLTPSRLRIVLAVTLVLILAAGAAGFYFAYGMLNKTADEVSTQVASAKDSETTLQKLQAVEKELNEKRDAIDRASRVTANSQNYTYQDQLVKDLTTYADRAQLTIKNISFSSGDAAAAAPAPTSGDDKSGDTANTTPKGMKSTTVSITVDSPANYQSLLNFLHYIEQNLTKLKVSKVSLVKNDKGMAIDALSIEVFIR